MLSRIARTCMRNQRALSMAARGVRPTSKICPFQWAPVVLFSSSVARRYLSGQSNEDHTVPSPISSSPHSPSAQPRAETASNKHPVLSAEQKYVLKSLQQIVHPELKQDIVFSGHVRGVSVSEGVVSITLRLDESFRQIKAECMRVVAQLPGVQSVRVSMDRPQAPPSPGSDADGSLSSATHVQNRLGLARVKNVIAVSSCKGGVGKSTVAVNLAFALSRMGLKVGIFDADIYGPSLPTLVRPRDTALRENAQKLLMPLQSEGVSLMSYGFVQHKDPGGASAPATETVSSAPGIMRGAMVSNVVRHLILQTAWGQLDYLVVDMPPGTGDIPITLCQQIEFTAALVISTPQLVSFVDVAKGMQMFSAVRVPIIGLVENMSYFECDNCSKKHTPFGPSHRAEYADKFGIRSVFELPLLESVSLLSDSGTPVVLDQRPGTAGVRAAYRLLAEGVVRETHALSRHAPPVVCFHAPSTTVRIRLHDGSEYAISPAELRRRCRCAGCVDELTGHRLLKDADVREDVRPTVIQLKGNYAVAMHWSDGHKSSIYPFDLLLKGASLLSSPSKSSADAGG